ncbi:AraC family transcriptional regulator [Rariglobus hedericola]|uniref:Helix-turn-helix domain-containing protein n=1 Tax=Rariglobus hedericola TaxID=2597822 RepID=A0A556QGG7_9BACT|nr:AraC family transcriptional regulator [Rariglobus hedericola]TSJ75726.1 helix-turn-helix domain-containing protein [Rariglobus hedericola]
MANLQLWQHRPRIQLAMIMPRASKRSLRYWEHTHSFHEIGFLLEGDCNWQLGTKRERLHAGDLLFVPAGTKHYEKTPAGASARIGWIGFDFGDEIAEIPGPLRVPLASGEYNVELKRLFETVFAERQSDALAHAERAELALREILILLCRLRPAGEAIKASRAPKTLRATQLMRSAALTLCSNLAQPMRIRDLAHYHSLSSSHFALLFRRHQGETPRRFLQNARLARAKVLLKEDALNVKEIAAACGYVDAAHFCHAFKAATKLTPKHFRERSRA